MSVTQCLQELSENVRIFPGATTNREPLVSERKSLTTKLRALKKSSYKITEFDKGKTRSKEHNGSQSAKSSDSTKNLSIFDRVRLNNADS